MTNKNRLYVTQGSGNSFKPMLVVAQTKHDCIVDYIDVLAGDSRKPEFLSINPQGQLPYLILPDGTELGESNAIAWYLSEGTKLMPDTSHARAQTIQWMNFEQTKLEANISPRRFVTYIIPELAAENKDMLPVWEERGNQALATLDAHLISNSFITQYGYCVADIAVYGYTHLADEGGFDLQQYKHVSAWIERVQNHEGYMPIAELLCGDNQQAA